MTDSKTIMTTAARERAKYNAIWKHHEYRHTSPAEKVMPFVWKYFERLNGVFIDYGCGTGRALKLVKDTGQFRCLGIDIASNCLDDDIAGEFPLLIGDFADLSQSGLRTAHYTPSVRANCGWCVDVLEHLDPAVLSYALVAMAEWSPDLMYFRIANFPEGHGPLLINEPLHLIFEDSHWWRDELCKHFRYVEQLFLEIDEVPERYSFMCSNTVIGFEQLR